MRRKIKWNTVFFWSMILVLAFLICNQKTIIREGFREGAASGACRLFSRKEYNKRTEKQKLPGGAKNTYENADKICRAKTTSAKCIATQMWGGEVLNGGWPCCWYPKEGGFVGYNAYNTTKKVCVDGVCAPKNKDRCTTSPYKKKAATKTATKAAPAETTKKATISPAKVEKKEEETKKAQAADEKEGVKLPSGTTTTKKERKARPPAKGGSGPGLDVDFGGDVAKWKITTGQGGNLEFQRDDKTVASFGNDGLIKGNKCSCGYWKLRDSRAGIPGRGDMNLHTDGWLRMLDYGSPEVSEGKHKISEYKKGGFSGKQLYYLKGGKDATLLG